MIFDFHYDGGHGWLKVKVADLVKLNIYDKISSYSYINDDDVYLEEDADYAVFYKAYTKAHGDWPRVNEIHDGSHSVIRSYDNFGIK